MTQYCIYKADFTIFIKYLLYKLLSTQTDNEILEYDYTSLDIISQ